MKYSLLVILILSQCSLFAQDAYFVDGFHGGVWGHYPKGYTEYMLSILEEHPNWSMNLEIEPDTWDRVKQIDTDSYHRMRKMLTEQSGGGRVEYVNPTYAQSYFFNTSGESVIRQFSYGMKKLRSHFPGLEFITYSSEEPCFTSALPQILNSFEIKYASLKNPNTCWGGYTSAKGGELVNWIGPDGTKILTVPRYEFEKLKPGSTWETIANANSSTYIQAAFDYGVDNPVGMCLQDAGWKNGPWLKGDFYKPSIYTTWRNYFENIANQENITSWKLNQEDIKVSLVWGSQVLQKIAQQVRDAENRIIQAEKIASMHMLGNEKEFPSEALDEAWKNLLLAQHHDCWIVPYNTIEDKTWAEKVKKWTKISNNISNNVIKEEATPTSYVKVYNTLGRARSEFVEVELPETFSPSETIVLDNEGNKVSVQSQVNKQKEILFKADIPAYGYKVFEIKKGENTSKEQASIQRMDSGNYLLETDIYKIVIDGENGSIESLKAKKFENKEFISPQTETKFNALKGFFSNNNGFRTNLEKKASFEILEKGPHRIRFKINTWLLDTPVHQIITLTEGESRIDFKLQITWGKNIEIGEKTGSNSSNLRKAFYNDKFKLLNYFPLNLQNQRIFKNAAFDVMESGLENTFYDSWDSIKNNIILDWVDVTDGNQDYGLALFTDHTTTYAHAKDFPLALNIQYSGEGLWGRNHSIEGTTEVNYALIPHKDNWETAGIWHENDRYKEPLKVVNISKQPSREKKTWASLKNKNWALTSVYEENNTLFLRVFNASEHAGEGEIDFHFNPEKIALVALNGDVIEEVEGKPIHGKSRIKLSLSPFGFKTIKLSGKISY